MLRRQSQDFDFRQGEALITIIGVVFPIFALIGLGYLGRRLRLLTPDAAAALSGYVYYFSLPALLYVRLSEVPVAEFFNGNLIFAYAGGILTLGLIVWGIGRLRRLDGRYLGMSVLNATFGNVGYMGVPFNMVAFGERGMPVVALTIVLTLTITIVLSVTLGLALLEGSPSNTGRERGRLQNVVLSGVLRNPILLSIALGIVSSFLAISLPGPVRKFLELLGDTAGPVALFAIGNFLEGARVPREWRDIGLLAGAKLLGLPLLTILWLYWLPVERVPFAIAVLQSGMPVAATNFIFAQQYGVAIEVTAAVTLVSTVLSLLTLSVLLFLLL
ncbi:MAG: AEC family transporter [Candidatus Methylomirabilis sp.]